MKTGLDNKPNRTSMKCKTFAESVPNVTCVIENKYISTEKSPVVSTEERLESDFKNTLNCNNNILNKENSFKNVDQKCFNSFRDQFADPVDKDTSKMTDSESCMAIDKCTNLIEDPKSTDILVQPLNDNSDLNSLCEDFKTIEELESGYNDHISDIYENIELECILQNVQKCNNFENLTVNEFCNLPEVKCLFIHLTTKYNFNSSPTLVPKENCILKNETNLLMRCIKDYVDPLLHQMLSSKALQSRKLFSGSVIKFAKRKMSIGEYSVIAELFKKREYLELPPIIAKLGNLALLVIFHKYRKREAANFINNP
ncbi:hypothetical protein CEXT_456561 [Caerostris extrusa]|uniref:Uncharacterized protein n=1 Tax=Caerostris extrusa TaxID=172846 RepID=A0AAV4Y242_CAEEX|nr:hypothetical protein CEXT_456561 [Caerostris extrusa]